jgi:N-methylhydantoinase A
VIGAAKVAETLGWPDVITADLGGTSFDASVIRNGRPAIRDRTEILPQLWSGLPQIDVTSIGAGGGSIATIDYAGVLQVGPESAGAWPGPACYQRGGDRATVTDALLVLGLLPPSLGDGSVTVSLAAAQEVIERDVALPMNLDVHAAAAAVYRAAADAMGNALRRITIERGLDPRRFRLISIGGCTALFAAPLAEILDIPEIAVPVNSGVFSAYGLLVAPVARSRAQTWHRLFPLDVDELQQQFAAIKEALGVELASENLRQDQITFKTEIDFKFRGQIWELTVELQQEHLGSADEIAERCIAVYEELYGAETASESSGIEAVNVRVRAEIAPPALAPVLSHGLDTERDPAKETRQVYEPMSGSFVDVVAMSFDQAADHQVSGPAILAGPANTLFVPPGWEADATSPTFTRVYRSSKDGDVE